MSSALGMTCSSSEQLCPLSLAFRLVTSVTVHDLMVNILGPTSSIRLTDCASVLDNVPVVSPGPYFTALVICNIPLWALSEMLGPLPSVHEMVSSEMLVVCVMLETAIPVPFTSFFMMQTKWPSLPNYVTLPLVLVPLRLRVLY